MERPAVASRSPFNYTPARISDFADEVLALYTPPKCRPGTSARVRRGLRALALTPGVETTVDLTSGVVDRFVEAWGASGPVMVPMAKAQYRLLCRIAVRLGRLAKDPFEGQPWPKVGDPELPSEEDVTRLLDHLGRHIGPLPGHRLYALAAAAAYAGLRVVEAISLRRVDIDLQSGKIRIPIRESQQPAFDPPLVELAPKLAAILDAWMRRINSEWLFPDSKGTGPASGNSVRRGHRLASLEDVGRELGIPGASFKGLRRSWELRSHRGIARKPPRSVARRFSWPGYKGQGPFNPMPIEDFAREVLKRYGAPGKSRDRYKLIKACMTSLMSMEGLTTTEGLTDALAERLAENARGFSLSFAEYRIAAYKTIFRIAVELGAAPYSSFIVHDRREAARDRDLSAEEVGRVLSHLGAAAHLPEERRLHALAATVAYTGLSRDEVLRLRVDDCDIRAGTIRIRGRSSRDTRLRHTVVSVEPRLAQILGPWLALAKTPWAFPDDGGTGQWSLKARDNLKERLRTAGLRAGVVGVTFRSLRRACIAHASEPRRHRLPGPGEAIRLYGKDKPPLTEAQHGSLAILIAAGADGLTRADMNALCPYSGWRQIFIAMRADADWRRAIIAPEGRHRGRWRFDPGSLGA